MEGIGQVGAEVGLRRLGRDGGRAEGCKSEWNPVRRDFDAWVLSGYDVHVLPMTTGDQ